MGITFKIKKKKVISLTMNNLVEPSFFFFYDEQFQSSLQF